jgi:hypothetical protein
VGKKDAGVHPIVVEAEVKEEMKRRYQLPRVLHLKLHEISYLFKQFFCSKESNIGLDIFSCHIGRRKCCSIASDYFLSFTPWVVVSCSPPTCLSFKT